jgi:predicted ATPase
VTCLRQQTIVFTDTAIEVQTGSQEKLSLSSLSSGEKQALNIFIESLLAGFNTFLIDEPEISLYIDWQRRLIASMHQLNNEQQIIAATHSPEIMADIPDKNIFRL